MDIREHCRKDAHLNDSRGCYAGIVRPEYLFARDVVKELQIQRMRQGMVQIVVSHRLGDLTDHVIVKQPGIIGEKNREPGGCLQDPYQTRIAAV